MKSAIRQITPKDYIQKSLENAVNMEMYFIVRKVAKIAEKAVNLQRERGDEYRGMSAKQIKEKRKEPHTPNYIDDSGNLRQSIGYMIALDGNPIAQDLQMDESRKLAQQALQGKTNGITLILTAGMEYACYVSRLGYDVLDSAEIFCKEQLNKMLEKYKK